MFCNYNKTSNVFFGNTAANFDVEKQALVSLFLKKRQYSFFLKELSAVN